MYSMIKCIIKHEHNINIANYAKVTSFLKRNSESYTPKKSKVFTTENVQDFLTNAPDDIYLLLKVVLIMGLNGACRCAELCKLNIDDITDTGEVAIVTLNDTK